MGRAEVGGPIPLLLSRHRTSSQIHPAGARELRVFKEFGCRLSVLTAPPFAWRLKSLLV